MGIRRLMGVVGLMVIALPVGASDRVKLRGGGVIRGLVVDHRSNDDAIKFRTDRGEMPILISAIERIERDADQDARYWLAREYFDETAEGFYDLALWCNANRLDEAYDEHLNDVIQLDPNHAEARKRLGFVRHGKDWIQAQPEIRNGKPGELGDRDVPHDDVVARRAEHTELLRQRQETLRKQQEIGQTVARIAARLDSTNSAQVQQARSDLASIRDPLAIGPLTKAMQRANLGNRIRLLQAIGEIPAPETSYALAIAAAVDVSPELRLAAIELMRSRPEDRDRYIPVLEQALHSEKEGLIANGAEALEALGERNSIPQLIDALMAPSRSDGKPAGGLVADPQWGWVRGLKVTEVWAGQGSVPIRAPS